MNVSLRLMSPNYYERWLPSSIEAFAGDKVRSGAWTRHGSVEKSRKMYAELVPQGIATPGHCFYEIVPLSSGPQGEAVGVLWIKLPDSGERPKAFIYAIEIDPTHQGKGYGSAAMLMLEKLLQAQGIGEIGLHVFGFNSGAQRLYQRLGYIPTSINMAKTI